MPRFHLLFTLLGLALGTALLVTGSAHAAQPPGALSFALAGCGCEADRAALAEFRDRIASTSDLSAARELALGKVVLASAALDRARRFVPWDAELGAVHERLLRYEEQVAIAASPARLAEEFSALMRLDGSQARAEAACDYSTGEIIAIVLGFILGILPGIILLILLC